MNIHPIKRVLGATVATALALGVVLAAAEPVAAQSAVPGAPGVADVSLVQGDVVIVRGDSGEQVGAAINAPLLPGDTISTAGGSRAEVQLDGISMLRLAEDTQVRFVSLNAGSREMQLATGTAELAELQGADGNPQIDTPSVSVRPDQTGDYRVSVLPNGQTLVTVRSGRATVYTGNGSQYLTPGTTLVAFGSYDAPSISLQGAIAYDAFDRFNADRDQAIVAAYNANPYVSPALSGYANFAYYGEWSNVPGYGEAWAPYNQSADWSPYSNGQWVWEPGYGYTWIGSEPWGYVPYHYGSWFYSTGYNEWMWQPPAYQYQNPGALASAWLPAMVAFFLTGGNPGAFAAYNPVSPYGYGQIGWVPLAPGEQYVPWYAGLGANMLFPQTTISPVSSITNVYNVYRNIRYIRVVRVIRVDRFRAGDFSHPTMLATRALRHIAFVRGAVPIVPTKALVTPVRPRTTVALSPRFHDPVFAKRASAIASVASFDRQLGALQNAIARKPAVVKLPARTAVAPPPVYRAPAQHITYRAPVQVTHPSTQQQPHATAQQHATAPQRATTPEQRFAPPVRQAVPERQTATERPVAPEQRFVPQQRVTPEQRAEPERRIAPVTETPHYQTTPRSQPNPATQRPERMERPVATPQAERHVAEPHAAPQRATGVPQHPTAAQEHKHQSPPPK
jgi:FecR protein